MLGQVAFGFEGKIAIFASVGSEIGMGANVLFKH